MRTEILGVGFDDLTPEEAARRGQALVETEGFHYAVTPNPEFLLAAKKDASFRRALLGADLVLADGVGVTYAAKILGRPLKGRVTGIGFAQGLMTWMARTGKRLYLLGAKPGVAELAAANLKAQHPGLLVCGTHDGYFQDNEAVAAQIQAAGAKVVFVCLGAPKQEWWIARYGAATGAQLMVGLGGALDVYAGAVKRAPEAWQKLGLEWCYRLLHQPSRVGRMAKLPLFLVQAMAQKGRGQK